MDNSQNSTVGNTLPLTSSSHSNQIVNKQSILHRWTNNATLIQLPTTIFCAHSIKSSHSACSSLETRTGSPSEGEKGRALTLISWQLWASSLSSTPTSCLQPHACVRWLAATSVAKAACSYPWLTLQPRSFSVTHWPEPGVRRPQPQSCTNTCIWREEFNGKHSNLRSSPCPVVQVAHTEERGLPRRTGDSWNYSQVMVQLFGF